MKKKMWIPIAAIVVVIAAVLFSGPVVVPFTGERTSDADGGIVMTAQFPVYDKSCDRLSVIIENNSDITAEFGDDWYLEKYVLGSWMNVPRSGEYYVNSILRILQPGGKFAFECGLKSFIGELDNGKYRILNKFNAETYSSEFEIGDGIVCDVETAAETAAGRVISPRKLSLRSKLPVDLRSHLPAQHKLLQ